MLLKGIMQIPRQLVGARAPFQPSRDVSFMGSFQDSRTQRGGDNVLHLRQGQSPIPGVLPRAVTADISPSPMQILEIKAALWPLWVELFSP